MCFVVSAYFMKISKIIRIITRQRKNGYYLEFQTQAEDRTHVSLYFSEAVSGLSPWPIKQEDFRLVKYSYREVLTGRV